MLGSLTAGEKIRSIIKKCVVSSRRNGAWFKLSKEQRSLLSLSLSLKVKFESISLLRALVSVIKRLGELGLGIYNSIVKGMHVAWVFSLAAEKWGNSQAKHWRNDRNYVYYLGALFC